MKNLFNVLFFLMLSLNLTAQTSVSGNQSGTWTASNSPYLVTDTITIPSSETLTIEPGVTVNFQGHYKFYVQGTLNALGTITDSVIFTANNHNEGWFGIRIIDANTISKFQYCKFEYGITEDGTYPDQHGGALLLSGSDAEAEHCVFKNNNAFGDNNGMGGAVYGINTSVSRFSNCSFYSNSTYGEGGAVKLSADNGTVFDSCVFIDNSVLYGGGAVCLYGCYDTRFFRCLFSDNYTSYSSGGAAFLEGYTAEIQFVNCTMINNEATGGDGGAVSLAYSDASFTNCIVYDNTGAYSDNIYLDMGGNAEVNYCNTPFPDGATGSNNINEDALFTDVINGDFYLNENSPCIDVGIDYLLITDAYNTEITVIDLSPEDYNGSMPDMGCYEYNPNINIETYRNAHIRVFPNPVNSFIKITGNTSNVKNIQISDFSGKTIYNKSQNRLIDVSEFSKGIYFMKIKMENGNQTVKFIKR